MRERLEVRCESDSGASKVSADQALSLALCAARRCHECGPLPEDSGRPGEAPVGPRPDDGAAVGGEGRGHSVAIAVVDGDQGASEAIRRILEGSAEFHCCGCFAGAAEALEAIPQLDVRIVVVGAVLPDRCGIQCVRGLLARRPGLGIILASSRALNEEMVRRALAAGVDVCCPKPLEPEWFLPLLRSLAARSIPEPRVAGPTERQEQTLSSLAEGPASKETGQRLAVPLTWEEDQVMACLAHGMLYKEAADHLRFSVAKVKNTQHKAYEKLGKHKALEAVAVWRDAKMP